MAWAIIHDGVVRQVFVPPPGAHISDCLNAAVTAVDVTGVTPAPAEGWTAVQSGSTWTFGPPTVPGLTLQQQAAAALAAGLTVTSSTTPALNGAYACDSASQADLTSLYSLIQRAGGAFPAGLTAMPWPDIGGAVHLFPSVAQFLALETAIGDFVLALKMIGITGIGPLPPSTAAIP